jgi:hypothetical protein
LSKKTLKSYNLAKHLKCRTDTDIQSGGSFAELTVRRETQFGTHRANRRSVVDPKPRRKTKVAKIWSNSLKGSSVSQKGLANIEKGQTY